MGPHYCYLYADICWRWWIWIWIKELDAKKPTDVLDFVWAEVYDGLEVINRQKQLQDWVYGVDGGGRGLFESVEFLDGSKEDRWYFGDDSEIALGSCAFVSFRILLCLPNDPQPPKDKRLPLTDITNSTTFGNFSPILLYKSR